MQTENQAEPKRIYLVWYQFFTKTEQNRTELQPYVQDDLILFPSEKWIYSDGVGFPIP